MNYLVTIHPDKEEHVFHFLHSLQELGIIEYFVSVEQTNSGREQEAFPIPAQDTYSDDFAAHYRDLVD